LINNHVTDCGEYVNSAYSGTATVSVINTHSRTRDNTAEATGIEQVKVREITTDTGGAETDFVDASTGDFRLRGTAPGQAAGIQANRDIGATQRAKPTVVA
jgi:CO/xanthine dehydrogenase Mo-binding subunit